MNVRIVRFRRPRTTIRWIMINLTDVIFSTHKLHRDVVARIEELDATQGAAGDDPGAVAAWQSAWSSAFHALVLADGRIHHREVHLLDLITGSENEPGIRASARLARRARQVYSADIWDEGALRTFTDNFRIFVDRVAAGYRRSGSGDGLAAEAGVLVFVTSVVLSLIDGELHTREKAFVEKFSAAIREVLLADETLRETCVLFDRRAAQWRETLKFSHSPVSERALDGAEDAGPLTQAVAALESLVGVETLKARLHEFVRSAAESDVPTPSRHLILAGKPGTGRNTAARAVARVYAAMGVLKTDELQHINLAELAALDRQTARDLIKKAFANVRPGLLLVSNVGGCSPVHIPRAMVADAIDGLIRELGDEFAVVLAETDVALARFFEAHAPLRRRFAEPVSFVEFSDSQLIEIFERLCTRSSCVLTDSARESLQFHLAEIRSRPEVLRISALDIKALFDSAVLNLSSTAVSLEAPSSDELSRILPQDIDFAAGHYETYTLRPHIVDLEAATPMGVTITPPSRWHSRGF